MNNTILVYAFAPWGSNNTNISELVLTKLSLPIDKKILRVRFDRQTFQNIASQGYKKIIGLGQYPSGNLIRIEKIARNIYGTKSKGYQRIDDGPVTISTNLELSLTKNSITTYNAGKYVCNYSMYTILSDIRIDQQFAFMHIPKNLSLSKAINYVEELLKQVV